jgi:hypothetical protein
MFPLDLEQSFSSRKLTLASHPFQTFYLPARLLRRALQPRANVSAQYLILERPSKQCITSHGGGAGND